MTLDGAATLTDVAFAVCTALEQYDVRGVLTGGSAATFYIPDRYQSLDVDFVLRMIPQRPVVAAAMADIGYTLASSGVYEHAQSSITVEFPRGPLAVGRDLIDTWHTARRAGEVLHVMSVTDCVRDRFMHFWAWNDRSALETAVEVATQHRGTFDVSTFREWTERERRIDSSYPAERVDEFLRRLK